MRSLCVIIAIGLSGTLCAQDSPGNGSDVEVAINRGLDFLVKDALRWKEDHQCASCHHAALTVWALREAKQHRYAVNEEVLSDLTKWMAESGDGKTSVPRPPEVPRAFNTKAVYFALGLASNPAPDSISQTGLQRLLATVKEDQLENGSWAAWPETRPPFFGDSNESMTALATLAVTLSNPTDAGLQSVRDKGLRWLHEIKTDGDPQSIAMRVVLWQKAGRPTQESEPFVTQIRQNQKSDGGWSQSQEMASDAWATGQMLYALSKCGISSKDDFIARGRSFLVKSQREDGSWPMTSRPTKPGGPGSTSLIPIIGGGSAWGVLGLVSGS